MIRTRRLRLVPASVESLAAELDGREDLERYLGIPVPESWPPELYDRAATEYTPITRWVVKRHSSIS